MRLSIVPAGIALLLIWVALAGCQVIVRGSDLRETVQAKVATDVAATLAAQEVPITLPLTSTVILISAHGQYVTAMVDGSLHQTPALSDCGRFTLRRQDGDIVALETCQNRWVTAPLTGTTATDWKVTQSPSLGDCGRFVLHVLGHNRVAFETCAGRWLTAVGDTGEPAVVGYVIALTYRMDTWEMFTMQLQP